MKILFAIFFALLVGCATTKQQSDIPYCSTIIKDFYAKVESEKLGVGLPFVTPINMIFIGVNPDDPREIKALCLSTKRIPKERTGCSRIGDVIGECRLGGDLGTVWYGEGEENGSAPE